MSLRLDQCVLETVSNYYGPEPSTNYCGAPLRVYMKKIILKFLSLSSLDLICFFVMPLLLYVSPIMSLCYVKPNREAINLMLWPFLL